MYSFAIPRFRKESHAYSVLLSFNLEKNRQRKPIKNSKKRTDNDKDEKERNLKGHQKDSGTTNKENRKSQTSRSSYSEKKTKKDYKETS